MDGKRDQKPGIINARRRWTSAILGSFRGELTSGERFRLIRLLHPRKLERPLHIRRFYILLSVSVGIATLGVISDSPAVVIGAMLISPLMTPILSASSSIALGLGARLMRTVLLLAGATLFSLLLAYLIPFLTALPPHSPVPEQALARANPSVFDLLVGLLAGSAGAYVLVRKDAVSAIPGVAIAVALVPPLASASVLFYLDFPQMALRALLLYAANLAAILLSGALVFMFMGFTPKSLARRLRGRIIAGTALAAVLVVVISLPLIALTAQLIQLRHDRNVVIKTIEEWIGERDIGLDEVSFQRNELVVVDLLLAHPVDAETEPQEMRSDTQVPLLSGGRAKDLTRLLRQQLNNRRDVFVILKPYRYVSTCGNRIKCRLDFRGTTLQIRQTK